jgi:N-acetylmuramoyl-L-alanine amidase
MFNRGVKQAGFLVLYKTAMPGVLVETGFISNPNNEKFLLSDKGQDETAQAIFKALRDYKYQVEKHPNELPSDTIVLVNRAEINRKQNSNTALISQATSVVKADSTNVKKAETRLVSYRVQFAMYPEAKPIDSKQFNGIDNVKMYIQNGSYKYTSGDFGTMEEAMKWRKILVDKGYKDAFVVAFKGKERIANEEAKRLTEKK